MVLIGDLTAYQDRSSAVPWVSAVSGLALVVLATPGASTAEIAARQVPRLASIGPSRVILQLGHTDVLDGFDESYVHARIVELCDELQRVAGHPAVTVVAMAPLPPDSAASRVITWRQCNAAAAAAARMRDFEWQPFDDT